jgi:tetrahydromethanopterin S-methyltransferase subunit C
LLPLFDLISIFIIFQYVFEENVSLPDFDIKTNNVINEIFVTISEIVDILKIIDPYKAFGPDEISHKMLEISPEKIAIPLRICILYHQQHI